MNARADSLALAAFGGTIVFCVGAAVWPDAPGMFRPQMPRLMVCLGGSFLAWWGAMWLVRSWIASEVQPVDAPVATARFGQGLWGVLIASAVLMRLVPIVMLPDVSPNSDDVFRYMWDGRMIAHGINPYYFAPDDALLYPLTEGVFHPNINHAYLPTIYPPVAQGFFWLAYVLTPTSIVGFKLVSLLVEIAAVIVLFRYMATVGIDRRWSIVYLWCPLIPWEFYYSAHLDVLAVPFLFGALLLHHRGRAAWAVACLGLAAGVKPFALVFMPLLFWRRPWRQKVSVVAAAVVAVAVPYLFFLRAGLDVFGSTVAYLGDWYYNASLYQIGATLLDDHPTWLRSVLGGCFVVWVVVASYRARDIERGWVWSWAGYPFFATTVFPWYMIWSLPALVRYRQLASLWFCGAVFAGYRFLSAYEHELPWASHAMTAWTEYVVYGVLLVLAVGGVRMVRSRDEGPD